jgi:hypothetical protein
MVGSYLVVLKRAVLYYFQDDFPSLLHFFTATDTQQVMKREPIFPQHFHNNFICWEGKGNKAPKMAS